MSTTFFKRFWCWFFVRERHRNDEREERRVQSHDHRHCSLRLLLWQIGEVIKQEAVRKTVAAADATQQDTSGGLFQEAWSVPGKGVGTGEEKTDDVVAQDGQSTA